MARRWEPQSSGPLEGKTPRSLWAGQRPHLHGALSKAEVHPQDLYVSPEITPASTGSRVPVGRPLPPGRTALASSLSHSFSRRTPCPGPDTSCAELRGPGQVSAPLAFFSFRLCFALCFPMCFQRKGLRMGVKSAQSRGRWSPAPRGRIPVTRRAAPPPCRASNGQAPRQQGHHEGQRGRGDTPAPTHPRCTGRRAGAGGVPLRVPRQQPIMPTRPASSLHLRRRALPCSPAPAAPLPAPSPHT